MISTLLERLEPCLMVDGWWLSLEVRETKKGQRSERRKKARENDVMMVKKWK